MALFAIFVCIISKHLLSPYVKRIFLSQGSPIFICVPRGIDSQRIKVRRRRDNDSGDFEPRERKLHVIVGHQVTSRSRKESYLLRQYSFIRI